MNIRTILPSEYPFLLRQIYNPPKKLDMAGEMPSDDLKYLCVIGARSYSTYGEDVCRHLIKGLQNHPIAIVSGLAIGIDSISHEAALDAGLKAVAFPGSGLSHSALYPASRRRLAGRILESGGALFSPFKFDQEGALWTFPTRNRLMAGMSHATLIIEARRGSGTLITAEYAAEFNRDILAVPGSIFAELSYGPHMLIERGATPITSSQDILKALGFETREETGRSMPTLFEVSLTSLSPEQRSIVEHVRNRPAAVSELLERFPMSSSAFNMLISELELKGIVVEEGGLYRITGS